MFPLSSDLGSAFLSCGMAFFSWDLAADRFYGDFALADIFGLEAMELAAGVPILSLMERICLDDRARVAASIHRAITSGSLYQERYRVEHAKRAEPVDVLSVGRCMKGADGVPFIYNGAIMQVTGMEVSVGDAPAAKDPLAGYCQSALELAQRRGNELAARYLSSALKVIGVA